MKIEFVDRSGLLGDEQRALGERYLQYALARFGSLVRRVTVVTQDTNGPKGGVDKQCRLSADLAGADDVHVEDVSDTWESCLGLAAKRLGRAVTRVAERRNDARRRASGASGEPSTAM